jgi:hypothetical protein
LRGQLPPNQDRGSIGRYAPILVVHVTTSGRLKSTQTRRSSESGLGYCGWSGQALKRHLTAVHGLSAEEYRNKEILMVDVLFAILFGGLAVFCLSFLTDALRTGQVVIFRGRLYRRAHLSTTTTCPSFGLVLPYGVC